MEPVPFSFSSVHAGFSQGTGLLHLIPDGLRCEYRIDVGGMGWKTSARELSVGLHEIASLSFKRGWFGCKARLYPASLKVLDRFPSSADDCAIFHFKRRDASRAALLISELELLLARRPGQLR